MTVAGMMQAFRAPLPDPKMPDGYKPSEGMLLSEVHINRYNAMLRRAEAEGGGVTGAAIACVDVPECRELIAIWEQVAAVGGLWEKIERDGKFEICDAMEDG